MTNIDLSTCLWENECVLYMPATLDVTRTNQQYLRTILSSFVRRSATDSGFMLPSFIFVIDASNLYSLIGVYGRLY